MGGNNFEFSIKGEAVGDELNTQVKLEGKADLLEIGIARGLLDLAKKTKTPLPVVMSMILTAAIALENNESVAIDMGKIEEMRRKGK